MRWPWRDLLFLHGHIVDHTMTPPQASSPEETPAATAETGHVPTPSLGRRSFAALRLCLGIGDGAIRTQ